MACKRSPVRAWYPPPFLYLPSRLRFTKSEPTDNVLTPLLHRSSFDSRALYPVSTPIQFDLANRSGTHPER